jgi:hypothetical protein
MSPQFRIVALSVAAAVFLGGCAELDFSAGRSNDGVVFYDPLPILVVTYNKDCSSNVSLITLPDVSTPRSVKPKPGYGSANLTVAVSNGLLTSFGQQTDTQVPETLTALGSIATAAAGIAGARAAVAPLPGPPHTQAVAACTTAPAVKLYRILPGADPNQISL